MKKMKVAYWDEINSPLKLKSDCIPDLLSENDIILRVRASVFGAALVRAVTIGHPKIKPPGVLGTLVAGDIISTGKNINLPPGTRIIYDPHPPCQKCLNCINGKEALCLRKTKIIPGGLSEYVRLEPPLSEHVYVLPEEISYAHGAYTEIVACVAEATLLGKITFGDTVIIIGCGPVGLIQIQLARLRGATKIICLHNHPERESIILRLGAIPLDVTKGAIEQKVKTICGDMGADVVIEAVGRPDTYSMSLNLVRPGGKIIFFGGSPPNTSISINPNHIHYEGIQLIGSYHYRKGLFERALKLLESGDINLDGIVSHKLPLNQIENAVSITSSPKCIALIIEP